MTTNTTVTVGRSVRAPKGCLVIFSLPFALVGLAMAVLIVRTTVLYVQASSWPEVPTQIQELRLARSKEGSGASVKVAGKYTYQFEGKEYSSERISLSIGSDNIGSFHQDLYNSLHEKQVRGETINCYVNPAQPDYSLLNRDLRLGMMIFYMAFGCAFGGVGFGLIGLYLANRRKIARKAATARKFPGQPWKIRDDWAQGYINSNAGSTAFFAGIFSVVVLVITLPVFIAVPNAVLVKKQYAALFALLFPAFGLGLGVWALRSAAVWKRFGRARLRPDKIPLKPGQRVQATLSLSENITPLEGSIQGTLAANKLKTTRFSNGRSETRSIPLHNESIIGTSQPSSQGTTLTFSFTMPNAIPTIDSADDDEPVTWQFHVRVKLTGADLALDFDLPVYR